MPARKKPAGTRQDNRPARSNVVALREDVLPIPATPESVLPVTAERWKTYWESQVAKAAEPVDLTMLHRLFRYYDRWERFEALTRKDPTVDGSMKQIRAHPLIEQMDKLESKILALEDRLGLNPKARALLGIQIGQAQLTAAEVNRMAAETYEHNDNEAEDAELAAFEEATAQDAD